MRCSTLFIVCLLCAALAPSAFGVTFYGDRWSDQTAALQNVIDTAAADGDTVIIRGTVRTTDHIYLYGDVSLVGDGTIMLDANPTYGFYWLNVGGKHYGATGSDVVTWTGKIQGITFKATANVTAAIRMINVHRCDGASILDCMFDARYAGSNEVGAIHCANNGAFVNPASKANLHIARNVCRANQNNYGVEGISVGNCAGLSITDNYVTGFGDDAIAVHACTDFTVRDNNCYAIDGRILVSNSQRGAITANRISRIPDSGGTTYSGGGMIWIELEYAYKPAPADLIIANNVLHHAAGLTAVTYGIRLMGARRCKVVNNLILDSSGYGYGVSIEPQYKSGWTDPEGFDNDAIARARDIDVIGNRATCPTASGTCNGLMSEGRAGMNPWDGYAEVLPGPMLWAGNRTGAGGISVIGPNSEQGYAVSTGGHAN